MKSLRIAILVQDPLSRPELENLKSFVEELQRFSVVEILRLSSPEAEIQSRLESEKFSIVITFSGDPFRQSTDANKNSVLREAFDRIKDLNKKIEEKNQELQQLRRGGVGSNHTISPPDAESLLDAFQDRFLVLRREIESIEATLTTLNESGEDPATKLKHEKRLEVLFEREQSWMRAFSEVAKLFKMQPKAKVKKSA